MKTNKSSQNKTVTKWVDIEGRFNVAGVQYSDYQLICGGIKAGTVVKLIGEPYNTNDKYAIRLEYRGIKLGYIPKFSIQQSELWRHHKAGRKCICVVTSFNKTNPTWCMITAQCRIIAHCIPIKKEIDFNKISPGDNLRDWEDTQT